MNEWSGNSFGISITDEVKETENENMQSIKDNH